MNHNDSDAWWLAIVLGIIAGLALREACHPFVTRILTVLLNRWEGVR